MGRRGKRKADGDERADGQPRLKLVVRRLPPNLPEQVFWDSVSPWVVRETSESVNTGAEKATWTSYKAGKLRQSGHKDKDSVASRAYIAFATAEALVNFHKAYDGWTFRDKSGRVSHAVVEFAPYQQTAPKTDRKDAKQGTIEQDPDYQDFLQHIDDPDHETAEPDAPVSAITPLIEHLRQKKGKGAKVAAKKVAKGKGAAASQQAADGVTEPDTAASSKKKLKAKKRKGAKAAAAETQAAPGPSEGDAVTTKPPRKRNRRKGKNKEKAADGPVVEASAPFIAPNVTPQILKNPDRPATSPNPPRVNLPPSSAPAAPLVVQAPAPSQDLLSRDDAPRGGRGRGHRSRGGRGGGPGKGKEKGEAAASEPGNQAEGDGERGGSSSGQRGRGSGGRHHRGRGRGGRGGGAPVSQQPPA